MTTFTATQWNTADQKKKWFVVFKHFIEGGCQERHFTKPLYNRLSNMFGHIAHYDKDGFFAAWFSTAQKRYGFVNYTIQYRPVGDPAYTWCDVEKSIILWLRNNPAINEQYHKVSEDERCHEDMFLFEQILNNHCDDRDFLLGIDERLSRVMKAPV